MFLFWHMPKRSLMHSRILAKKLAYKEKHPDFTKFVVYRLKQIKLDTHCPKIYVSRLFITPRQTDVKVEIAI